MGAIKCILALIKKDWHEFFSSKAWIIVVIMPVFICFLYSVVYRQAEAESFEIAYPQEFKSGIIHSLASKNLKFIPYQNLGQAKKRLLRGEIDGVFVYANPDRNRLTLLADKARSKELALLVNTLNVALIRMAKPDDLPQIKLEYVNKAVSTRWVSLPVWLLQVILTVCLLQAAAAVADEKSQQTLHSLLVTPMLPKDYLIAKILWNSLVGLGALLLTLVFTNPPLNIVTVLVYGLAGALAYSALSVAIGLLTPNALFARTIATLIYIISALPIMVRDLSFAGKDFLNIFPSFLILQGLENSLSSSSIFSGWWILLALLLETGLLIIAIRYYLNHKTDF